VAEFRQLLKAALAELGDSPTDSRISTESVVQRLAAVGAGTESNPTLDQPRTRRVAPGLWLALAAVPLLLVGAGGLLVVALVLGWSSAGGPAPVPPPAPLPPVEAPSPPAPAAPTPFHVASEPAGAEVWEGTRMLGVTPLDLELLPGAPPRTLEVRLAGHVTQRLSQAFSASPVEVRVALEKVPRASPRPRPERPKPVPDDIRIER
jgi:hypothetical protein